MNKKSILAVILVSALVGAIFYYAFEEREYILSSIKEATEKYQKENTPTDFSTKFAETNDNSNNNKSEYPDLTYAAERTVKTVVGIENVRVAKGTSNQYYGGNIDPFLEMFGLRKQQRQQPKQEEQRSGGSGVIVSEDGYIVTNNHVIENADRLMVKLENGNNYPAKIIGSDPTTDIALIKIEENNLPFSTFGSSENLRLGEWVLAVGNPYGLSSTVTAGIVSAKGRNLDVIPNQFRIESFIQTDAAVNPGNSGGPLVNTNSEIIGINTVIKSPTGSYAGYSFAVPSSIVKKIIVDLIEYGIVQRAVLGVEYQEIDDTFKENYAKELGVSEDSGLYVARVLTNEAADIAGIRRGDIIFEIDGKKITNSPALKESMAKRRPNEKIDIGIKRDGQVKHFDVILRNMDGEAKLLNKNSIDVVSVLGGEFSEISNNTLRELNIESGVQVTNVGRGLLEECGIQEGYIITHINGRSINTISDLRTLPKQIQLIDGIYPNGRGMSYRVIEK